MGTNLVTWGGVMQLSNDTTSPPSLVKNERSLIENLRRSFKFDQRTENDSVHHLNHVIRQSAFIMFGVYFIIIL